jgi:hypothetical protein
MADMGWYYGRSGRQTGPMPFVQLKHLAVTGHVQPDDLVWTEGYADWIPAGQVEGLFDVKNADWAAPPPMDGPPYPPSGELPPIGRRGIGDMVFPTHPPKDPTLMAILSLLVPGLGQMVLGQTAKGIVLLVAGLVLGATTCFGGLVIWGVAVVDAYQIGKKLQSRRPVAQWEFF